MTDYGHDLQFGAFLTPSAANPAAVVELARHVEAVGLDLVTFQDHPYQPAHLDTWTLLSYVAAATERIQLSGNVLNLPLRPPAVLAGSVASLDLLTGGRVALGLGAGGFWDAIEAYGGGRRNPGQSIEALEEAITILREVWDVDQRRGVRVDGEHYRVVGAKRGPAPAHDVPIWLGAYKPRMLRLVGRVADGALPSLMFLPGPEALGDMHAIIDESAHEAGRAPNDVRRLLNVAGRFTATSTGGMLDGPIEQWVEQLADLALAYGVSTFILASDDAHDLATFGDEVAPAVRELVDRERRDASEDRADDTGDQPVAGGAGSVAPASVAAPGHAPTAALGVDPTPDDGVRRSATRLWEESDRPSAPPPPEGHEYTARGRALSSHLVEVHDHLRGELNQLRDAVDQVRAGAARPDEVRSVIDRMTMRQNDWTIGAFCSSFCRTVTTHHTLEDTGIFPNLRAAEPGLGPVIDRLEVEHHVIHEVLGRVDDALVAFVAAPDDFTAIDDALDLLSDTLLSHLAYEERELLEPLSRHGFYAGQL